MADPVAEASVQRLSWRKKVLYSLVPAVLLLVALETGARLIEPRIPPRTMDLGLGFNPEVRLCRDSGHPGRLTMPHPNSDTLEGATFATEKPAGVCRIFMLGGSSVAFLQDQFRTLEARLNERFRDRFTRVEVINVGMWSYGSQRVLLVAREVLEYEPDLLVLYTGHNEFEDLRQLEIAHLEPDTLSAVLGRFALFRVYWSTLGEYKLRVAENRENMKALLEGPFPSPEEWEAMVTPNTIPERMRSFRNNLRIIARMSAERGVPLIIGTVPSNHWNPSLPGEPTNEYNDELLPLREAGEYETYYAGVRTLLARSLRRQSSDAENRIIVEVAEEYGLPTADVEAAVRAAEPHGIPGETLFDDPCHLNDRGNDIWLATVEPVILRTLENLPATAASSGVR